MVFPCEGLADDNVKVSVGRRPAKAAANLPDAATIWGRIAGAAGAEADVEGPTRGAPDGLDDDFQHQSRARNRN